MRFTKMQGCGNDYIYINCFEEQVEDPEALAIRLSNRNFGIGSDGIILIKPSDSADFFMDMYNLDGSRGRMCGNAIRCVGKYVFDRGMTAKSDIDVETLSGIKHLHLTEGADGKIELVTVDMNAPITAPAGIPVRLDYDKSSLTGAAVNQAPISAGAAVNQVPISADGPVIQYPLSIDDGTTYPFTFVSMGNPHAVTFVDSPADLPLETIGPKFEFHPIFPERANIEFVHVTDRTHIEFRVWERGSGETKACGTGACASVFASILNGFTDNEVHAKMLGGELIIRYDEKLNRIFMTGPAVEVFTGEIEV